MDRETAESVAVAALGFIAADPELLRRFLAITGIDASMIRKAATEPGFLAGVLAFVMAHEPTLLCFAEHADIPPQNVVEALRKRPGGDGRYEQSA